MLSVVGSATVTPMGVCEAVRGLDVHLDTSTVTINGRRFPAVAVITPIDGSPNRTRYDRLLGPPSCVYIPCENGVMIGVERDEFLPEYSVWLSAHQCSLDFFDHQPSLFPTFMEIRARALVPVLNFRALGPFSWSGASSEWLVEHIDRVGRLPCTLPDGPLVTVLSLKAADEIVRRHNSHHRGSNP